MTVKVLVTAIGQQIVTTAKQIENKETGDLVGYWMSNPRVVGYTPNEDDNGLSVNFAPYCLVSDESEFSIRSEHIVAILEPRADVVEAYLKLVTPEETSVKVEGTEDAAINPDVVEGSDVPDLTDGTTGDGAESSPS